MRFAKKEGKTMTKFETGKTYTMRSACNHECVWAYTVTARAAATITLTDETGKTTKCRIIKALSEMDNRESVNPLGTYSMSPILRA